MFSTLLDAVDSQFPESLTKLTHEQLNELLDEVLPWLHIESESLIGAAKALFGEKIFDSSEIGFEYLSTKQDQDGYIGLPISIGSIYIRPDKNDQTISLNLTMLRGFTSRLQYCPSSAEIELEICDSETKSAFEYLYKNYRAQLIKLLEQAQISFFTSYCSDIVGNSKSNKVSVKLDEYFSDQEVDNWFTLSKSCSRSTPYSAGIKAFLVLSILYIYCRSSLAGKNGASVFERNLLRII